MSAPLPTVLAYGGGEGWTLDYLRAERSGHLVPSNADAGDIERWVPWGVHRAAHSMAGARDRWVALLVGGPPGDAELQSALSYEFGGPYGGGQGCPVWESPWLDYSGGANPSVTLTQQRRPGERYEEQPRRVVVRGRRLLVMARAVLGLNGCIATVRGAPVPGTGRGNPRMSENEMADALLALYAFAAAAGAPDAVLKDARRALRQRWSWSWI